MNRCTPMPFDCSTPFLVTMILGFLFCASWLPVMAASDTTAPPGSPLNPQVPSTYNNANKRPDPFLPVKLKGRGPEVKVTFNDSELHLRGILWHPTKPVAIINRQSIGLNETVTLKLSSGEFSAKAVSIEREKVVLKLGDHEVTLQLER